MPIIIITENKNQVNKKISPAFLWKLKIEVKEGGKSL